MQLIYLRDAAYICVDFFTPAVALERCVTNQTDRRTDRDDHIETDAGLSLDVAMLK